MTIMALMFIYKIYLVVLYILNRRYVAIF